MDLAVQKITGTAGKGSVNVGVTAGGGLGYEQGFKNAAGENFNIHVKNKGACKGKRFETGMLQCLREGLHFYSGLGGYVACEKYVTATKSVQGGWKLQVFGYGVDLSGEWTEKRTYNVQVRVPAEG